MKNIVFLFFLIPLLGLSQNREGLIVYNESIKMEIDIPEEHREQLKGILPTSRDAKKVLLFNTVESLYKDQEGQDDEVVETGDPSGGMHMKMIIERPDNQLYKNLEENQIHEKQEFFGRTFLIIDEVKTFPWKLTNEQKEILGYVCQKAILTKDDKEIEAWFSPQIPVSTGPMSYGQLPGLILELDIDHGDSHIVAYSIDIRPLEKDEMKAPKKGKKVSREEFEKIVKEKQKEMEEEMGGSGNQMIFKVRKG